MNRVRIAFPVVMATALAVTRAVAESAGPRAEAKEKSPILSTASAPATTPPSPQVRPRAISPAAAAQLAAAAPKFRAIPLATSSEAPSDLREIDKPRNAIPRLPAAVPNSEATTPLISAEAELDLREIDKPRNAIIRLPPYIVQERKPPPVLKERELRTPKAQLEIALKRFPGLRFGSFWIFRNDALALAMLAEEERLERKREFEDLASLMQISDPAAGATVKRQVERAFMHERDFGR